MDTITEFKKCLLDVSFSRAGWDVMLSAVERAEEAKLAREGLSRAREIWASNPDAHDQLRTVFGDMKPLVTMSEIENQKVGA